MEEDKHLWILGSLKTIMTKIGSLDDLIVMSMDIWQRIAGSQKKRRKLGSVTSAIKWDTLQRIEAYKKK